MKVYSVRLKSRKRINAEISRNRQGWWADVCPGKTLILRDATEADIARCFLNDGASRDPADYWCELSASGRGSLVAKFAAHAVTELY